MGTPSNKFRGVEELCMKLQSDPKTGITDTFGREDQFGSNQLDPPALSPFYMCMFK